MIKKSARSQRVRLQLNISERRRNPDDQRRKDEIHTAAGKGSSGGNCCKKTAAAAAEAAAEAAAVAENEVDSVEIMAEFTTFDFLKARRSGVPM